MTLPRYNLAWLFRRKDQLLADEDLTTFVGQTVRRVTWSRLCQTVAIKLKNRVPLPVVRESLQYLAGQELTWSELESLLWRLLGNLDRLRNGHAVLPWQLGGAVAEWVPVQLGDCRPIRKAKRPGVEMQFTILAGLPAGMETSRRISYAMAGMLASRLGFSRPRGPHPYSQVQQLFGMRTYAMVSPDRSHETPYLEQFYEQPTFLSWNRQLLMWRQRDTAGGYPCPKRLPVNVECYRCPAGLDACPVACRSVTWRKTTCRTCGKDCWLPQGETQCPGCISEA